MLAQFLYMQWSDIQHYQKDDHLVVNFLVLNEIGIELCLILQQLSKVSFHELFSLYCH